MEIIRNNQQQKATALRSYLNRMKTDIFYRESEIATVKSQFLLVEDLTYDIMEIAIQLLGEYETNERIEERTSKRKEVEKLNNFISKGDHITRKHETFLNGQIEIAKEQLIVDGSFNDRPNSSMTKIEEKEFNKEIIFAENANQFTLYNYKTRTEMKKKKMVRIPLLINRRAPLIAADLEPDEFELLHSSMKNDSFVFSNGKISFMKNGEFVEVDPSRYE